MSNWIPDMWQRKVAHSTEDAYNTFSEFAEHIRDHHPELLNSKGNNLNRKYVLSPEGAARMDKIHTPENIQHMIRTYTRQIDSARQEIDNIPSFTDKEWKNMGVTFNGKPHTGSRINCQLPGVVKYAHDDLHPWPMTEQEAATHVLSSGHHEEIIREMISKSGLSREESIQGILKNIKSHLAAHTMVHKNQPFGKSSHEHDEEPLKVDIPETIETIIPTTIGAGPNVRRADKTDKLNSGKDHWQQRYASGRGWLFGRCANCDSTGMINRNNKNFICPDCKGEGGGDLSCERGRDIEKAGETVLLGLDLNGEDGEPEDYELEALLRKNHDRHVSRCQGCKDQREKERLMYLAHDGRIR